MLLPGKGGLPGLPRADPSPCIHPPTQTKQVVFFSQGALPALSEGGRIVMESPSRLAMAPDGNGGVYVALRGAGVLADMAAHGVECVDCYCVDNALVRLGDPLFVGFCASQGAECGESTGAGRVVAEQRRVLF